VAEELWFLPLPANHRLKVIAALPEIMYERREPNDASQPVQVRHAKARRAKRRLGPAHQQGFRRRHDKRRVTLEGLGSQGALRRPS
jgi:hypothetical protein